MSRSSLVRTGELEPPGNQNLISWPFGGPPAKSVDDLPGWDPELDLVVAGPLDVAGDRHQLGTGGGLGAELGVLLAAHVDDVGTVDRVSTLLINVGPW